MRVRNAKDSMKKGEVKTPSSYNKVYLPVCLVWESEGEEEPHAPPFASLTWLTPEQRATVTAASTKPMSDEDCIKALALRLIEYLKTTQEQQQATTATVDDLLATMLPNDVQQLLLKDDAGVVTSALKLTEADVGSMEQDQLRELVKQFLKRLREQQQVLEAAQHRVESKQRETAAAPADVMVVQPEAQKTAAMQLYEEKDLAVADWSQANAHAFNPGWMPVEPADPKLVQTWTGANEWRRATMARWLSTTARSWSRLS